MMYPLFLLSLMASVYYNTQTDKFMVMENMYDEHAVARGILDNGKGDGWTHLQIEAPAHDDYKIEGRAIGFVEGYLTRSLFKNHYNNVMNTLCQKYVTCDDQGNLPTEITDFFKMNYEEVNTYLKSRGENYDNFTSSCLIGMSQFRGLIEGYSYDNYGNLTENELWLYLNHESIFNLARRYGVSKFTGELYSQGTCFISHSGNFQDIFFGHNSWKPYGYSQRIAKRFKVKFHKAPVERYTFSSYPFMLHSSDNFEITDAGLVHMTSSIAINDAIHINPLYEYLPTWLRSYGATKSSQSASMWCNSYNTNVLTLEGLEHVVVDLKQFKYKESFHENFLYVLDEIPKEVKIRDFSYVMNTNYYFVSADIPHIEDIYIHAGYPDLAAIDPKMYSSDESIRYKIFEKFHGFNTYEELKNLMRLNDLNLAEQEGSPKYASAARYDLLQQNKECYGAIDAKVTSLRRVLHLIWEGAPSPTYDDVKPLVFSEEEVCSNTPHEGIPDKLQYSWTQISSMSSMSSDL
ncbi:Phospholipase B [Histomonas meleagridis]|uniref:Phospholipase B n=1 Tax=Histomonas meleagridis TaxID=135588 RepID=UPI00355AAC8F|nr:Phospholipase B [Histomonas meleagridis]KAH0800774.1 Phospholipase B [Histomonas meleagridis]